MDWCSLLCWLPTALTWSVYEHVCGHWGCNPLYFSGVVCLQEKTCPSQPRPDMIRQTRARKLRFKWNPELQITFLIPVNLLCSCLDLLPLPQDVLHTRQPGTDPPQQHYSGPGINCTPSQPRRSGKYSMFLMARSVKPGLRLWTRLIYRKRRSQSVWPALQSISQTETPLLQSRFLFPS